MNSQLPGLFRVLCNFFSLRPLRSEASSSLIVRKPDAPTTPPVSKQKSPALIPAMLREPNAGLVSLTMTCRVYLVFMDARETVRGPFGVAQLRC